MSQTISKTPAVPNSQETADYMTDMTLELLKMAKSQSFRALEQIYEMAYYEAYSKAHPVPISAEDMEAFADLMREIRRGR